MSFAVQIVSPTACVFCTQARHIQRTTGTVGTLQAGLISSFVIGAAMAPASQLQLCAICEGSLGEAIKHHNAQVTL